MLTTEAQRALFHVNRCIRLCDHQAECIEYLQNAKGNLEGFAHAYRKYLLAQERDTDSYPFLSANEPLDSLVCFHTLNTSEE